MKQPHPPPRKLLHPHCIYHTCINNEVKKQLEDMKTDLIVFLGSSGFKSDDVTPDALDCSVQYNALVLQQAFVAQMLNHGFDEPFR